MKPAIGWTMLSREEMRHVERALANDKQGTRDEIGFLLLHQGFADRFFPGTSVLHTRIRYALFVPWLYQRAARSLRGSDLDSAVRRLFIELAIRLKRYGGEPFGVIGGDKLGVQIAQSPDGVYWTALRTWGLLLPTVFSRSDALRRLRSATRPKLQDDDGGALNDESAEVFVGLPDWPDGWDKHDVPLHFQLPAPEREFLRRKLRQVVRSRDPTPSLLASLVAARDSFEDTSPSLPRALNARADPADRIALDVARDAASLAAIGRAVYGALVEELCVRDGASRPNAFRPQLAAHFEKYGEAAGHCDLDSAEALVPDIPTHVRSVLRETRSYVREGNPDAFLRLRDCYQKAEILRKSTRRARLSDTESGAQRRREWNPDQHNTEPLHYRWHIVRAMLSDLNGSR